MGVGLVHVIKVGWAGLYEELLKGMGSYTFDIGAAIWGYAESGSGLGLQGHLIDLLGQASS